MLISESLKRPAPGDLESFPCPRCGAVLIPVLLPHEEVSFTCDRAHSFTGQELFAGHPQEFLSSVADLLSEWEQMLRVMAETAGEARLKGHGAIGEIFDRQVRHMEQRIRTLRSALSKSVTETWRALQGVCRGA